MVKRQTALVIIDMQRSELLGCHNVAEVLSHCQELVERARQARVPVVWLQHDDEWLPRGSAGWQLAPGLLPAPGEDVVYKQYLDGFAGSGLASVLERAGAERLVIAGAQTDSGIRTTVQRAAVEGYDVTLVSDANTTTDSTLGDVTVPAAHIIAHNNAYTAALSYPTVHVGVAPTAAVELGW